MAKTTLSHPAVGTLGNLTPDEDAKLRQTWAQLLRLCGTDSPPDSSKPPPSQTNGHANGSATPVKSEHAAFRDSLWQFILGDHPDALALRFLRARKWDTDAAVEMLVAAARWRDEVRLNETVIFDGEDVILRPQPSALDREFIAQWRLGKSYVSGTDREGRLVYVVRVRLHDPSKQSAEAMERYVLHSIESLRLVARPPQDQACLVFDLTGFGLGNMDFHVVKFIVQVFEARYPETLGLVLVHNAPFVFWGTLMPFSLCYSLTVWTLLTCPPGIWSIVKRWLDPNVASKVAFTNGKSGLSRYIAEDKLAKEYGGKVTTKYEYAEPVAGENDRLRMDEKRAELQSRRWELIGRFEELTREWMADGGDAGKAEEREVLVRELQAGYWRLDPYVRARTHYHRTGAADGLGG